MAWTLQSGDTTVTLSPIEIRNYIIGGSVITSMDIPTQEPMLFAFSKMPQSFIIVCKLVAGVHAPTRDDIITTYITPIYNLILKEVTISNAPAPYSGTWILEKASVTSETLHGIFELELEFKKGSVLITLG